MRKISIISPVYNAKEMLKRSLESVLRQDYPVIEHVVVDGDSPDGSAELLKEYEKKYEEIGKKLIWVSEKDNGMIDATNKAYKLASGDLLIFLSDVYYNDHIISKIVSAFDEEELDYAYGGIAFQKDGRIIRSWSGRHGNWRLGWMIAHPTLCVTRTVWEKHGPYIDKYLNGWDYDFEVKLFKDESLKYKNFTEPLLIYYAGGTSNGGLKGKWNSTRDSYFVLKDNHVEFALFITLCRILRVLCSYVFIKDRKVELEDWMR